MGYVPLFDTLATGTLHGRWPDIGLWPVILSMADRFGNVDVTPQYIAGVTGLQVPEVIACLERFCGPDEDSRSGENDGRRLTPLEAGRKWGWRVVNHAKYREKARLLAKDSARTASGMDAKRKAAERARPPKSPEFPLSDEDGNVYVDPIQEALRAGLDRLAWEDWVEYRGKRKPIKPESLEKAAKAMAALGAGQRAAVDHSIANGYQGLFSPKEGPNGGRDRPTRYAQLTAKLDRQIAEDDKNLAGDDGPVRGAVAGDLRRPALGHVGKPDRATD